jgi:hypothetical protein
MGSIQTSRRPEAGRRQFLGVAAWAIAADRLSMSTAARAQGADAAAASLPIEGKLPPLTGATAWINSAPLAPADLRGKVVLVEFWTYTCINWLRSHAYVRAWAQKYREQGLVVIGAHTPEFPFERQLDNVRFGIQAMQITYPIAVDTDYAIWRAFENNYWPAFYVIDAQGRTRHHQFGEGSYDESERIIQRLLTEAGATGFSHDLASVDGQGFEAAADWADLKSPETYLDYQRAEGFASRDGGIFGRRHSYAAPAQLTLNQWALSGDWTMDRGFVAPNAASGRIVYRFHARDVHLVMGSLDPSKPVRFRVTIDGAVPGANHGLDIDADGWGSVQEPRLYQLVRQSRPITERTFVIEYSDVGARAYCFTFG